MGTYIAELYHDPQMSPLANAAVRKQAQRTGGLDFASKVKYLLPGEPAPAPAPFSAPGSSLRPKKKSCSHAPTPSSRRDTYKHT